MTAYYVRSGAAGAGTGADWANAYTTLAAAFSGKAAGDTFYMSEDHSESQASLMTLTSPGTIGNPCFIYCVNHSGSVPPVSADLRTTASMATTGNNSITFAGTGAVYYGVIFLAGNSTGAPFINLVGANSASIKLVNCSLRLGSTGGATIAIGNGGSSQSSYVELENTTAQFAATGNSIQITSTLKWKNTTSALLGTIPTTLFGFSAQRGGRIVCEGVDFSAAGSGKTIVGNTAGATGITAQFTDCKINASVTLASTPATHDGPQVDFVRVGSSGVNYNHTRVRYTGTLTEETTIVRTGGASDGTTTLSWKIVTTANSNWHLPFESAPIAIWNDTISPTAVTATVEGIWGGGAVPNNDDIWIEVEYLGASGSPLGSFVSDTKADPLSANAALTSSSETWGGSTTKFKMAATFTAQQKGWVLVRVKAAKASSTFYVDPKITLS